MPDPTGDSQERPALPRPCVWVSVTNDMPKASLVWTRSRATALVDSMLAEYENVPNRGSADTRLVSVARSSSRIEENQRLDDTAQPRGGTVRQRPSLGHPP